MRKIALAAAALALAAGLIPPATAALLVTEPFNYPARVYPAGNWAGLSGSVKGSVLGFDNSQNSKRLETASGWGWSRWRASLE